MRYEAMLVDVFQQPGAYPFPCGSAPLGALYALSDAELRRWSTPRLRDQAVSVFGVFEYYRGQYMLLHHLAEQQGLTPYLDAELTNRLSDSNHEILVVKKRGRALTQAYVSAWSHISSAITS
jgi:hypothetical protein